MLADKRIGPLLVGAAVAILALAEARPASAVTVSVSPPDTAVSALDQVTVRIRTDAVSDLKAFELIFDFDPLMVQLVDILPGDVLTSTGSYTAFRRNDYAAPADTAWFDAGVLTGTASGPGILAFFQFQVVSPISGQTPIRCRLVDFRDSQNVSTHPACEDGLVRVIGPVQTTTATWGRIKAIHR